MLTITVLLLLTVVRAEGAEGGEGGGEGGFGGDHAGGEGDSHVGDIGSIETADGHVEDGDVYYYGDTAVSSKSSLTSLYIIAFYLHNHQKVTINNTCLIEPLADFLQSEATNATDYIINFEMTLDSLYTSYNSSSNNSSNSYNLTMFHDFFNSLNSQTQSLVNLCVTNSASLTVGNSGIMLLLLSIYFVAVVLQ